MDYCAKCGCEIHQFLTGKKHISDKVHCDNCYYEELGAIIEKHPLGVPIGVIINDK